MAIVVYRQHGKTFCITPYGEIYDEKGVRCGYREHVDYWTYFPKLVAREYVPDTTKLEAYFKTAVGSGNYTDGYAFNLLGSKFIMGYSDYPVCSEIGNNHKPEYKKIKFHYDIDKGWMFTSGGIAPITVSLHEMTLLAPTEAAIRANQNYPANPLAKECLVSAKYVIGRLKDEYSVSRRNYYNTLDRVVFKVRSHKELFIMTANGVVYYVDEDKVHHKFFAVPNDKRTRWKQFDKNGVLADIKQRLNVAFELVWDYVFRP